MCVVGLFGAFFVGIYCGLKTDKWQKEAAEEIEQYRREKGD